ncbi:HpcH/HpaI aldolase/citrate lyase family protein [Pontibacillus sp. ALD_SL1]|uniref:HpcH/HpaI aldolase/citrate lyase family protein n=1 Tax=Pontibacillus sp. ALD_SL1 TaxID=2777185 RepID=UPI001A966AE0|nr:HpcH/HpaI aldolase/citrate lyase family protein [Pontibacillus sp. ALD_SL1]QSS99305.1 HpcH/HpaI aldolase/citrate lyase family protein [Pontibacillus sp. ALD_SL1]
MKHFNMLTSTDYGELFYKAPQFIGHFSSKREIARALGATLYIPALKDRIGPRLMYQLPGLSSAVLCLEDSINDEDVQEAEEHLIQEVRSLRALGIEKEDLPFLFIRVRNVEQMKRIAQELKEVLHIITGFVLPKFCRRNGLTYLQELQSINEEMDLQLYAMPIIETEEFLYKETRLQEMNSLRMLFDEFRHLILNIRIGGTDLSGIYGMRRKFDSTIYDISLLNDFIGDMVNFFGRNSEEYMISGPVWEFFDRKYADTHTAITEGSPYVHGFIEEIQKDQLNGLCGKTIIHPSHIELVNAMHVVSKEDYRDALEIVHKNGEGGDNGVSISPYANKMNEAKPHLRWAREIIMKSNVYGVFHEDKSYVNLLEKEGIPISNNG